jgi:hypothetical protein
VKYFLFILFLYFLIFPLDGRAQDSVQEMLNGRVYDKYNKRNVSYAHIINRAKASGTISDSTGVFTIPAETGDTLFISAMGYQFDLVHVDSVTSDTSFVLNLVPRAYMLPEVVIYELNTYEKFKKRFVEVEVEDDRYHIPGLPHFRPMGIPSLRDTNYIRNPLFALRSPISFLYYNFSRKEKNRRKYYQLLEEDELKRQARIKYPDELIMEVTDLEPEEIEDFLFFCDFNPRFILSLNDYEIINLIKEKYRQYQLAKRE